MILKRILTEKKSKVKVIYLKKCILVTVLSGIQINIIFSYTYVTHYTYI